MVVLGGGTPSLLGALLLAASLGPPSTEAFHHQLHLLRTRRRTELTGSPVHIVQERRRRKALRDDDDDDDDDDDGNDDGERRPAGGRRVPTSLSVRGGRRRTLSSLSGGKGDVRELLVLAGPVLLSGMVDPFLSVVDTAYCGRLGPAGGWESERATRNARAQPRGGAVKSPVAGL